MRYVYADEPEADRLMPPRTFIDAIRETLADEMRRDESIIVLGEDVGKKGGVFLATDGLWAEFGDDRVIDTPLTESMIVGASIGAAVNGLRPVAEIQFADFIFPAFNQIVSEAARMRYRSNNGYGVPMTIRAPYGGGVHGALYHSQSVEAFFTHVPGLKVVVPSTPYDARGLLRSSIRDDDPVLFFEHKKMYRSVRGEVPDTDYTVPLGEAEVTHPGLAGHGRRLRADGALRARGGRPRRRGRASASRSSTCGRCGRSTARRCSTRSARPASAWSSTRTTGSAATARRSPRSSPRRRSTTSTARSRGSPARTCRACPYNHVLEDWFMVNPEKIADGDPDAGGVLRRAGRWWRESFDEVHARLRALLEPYAPPLFVTADGPAGLRRSTWQPEGQRDPSTWFGGTRLGKRYVSYYLMPVYVQPVAPRRHLAGAPPAWTPRRSPRGSASSRPTEPAAPGSAPGHGSDRTSDGLVDLAVHRSTRRHPTTATAIGQCHPAAFRKAGPTDAVAEGIAGHREWVGHASRNRLERGRRPDAVAARSSVSKAPVRRAAILEVDRASPPPARRRAARSWSSPRSRIS